MNVIPITQPSNDADVFIRACNSPAQQARRMERRKAQQRKAQRAAISLCAGLIAVGAVLGLLLGAVI